MQTLYSSNFRLNGKSMYVTIPGNILVFFTQSHCGACNAFMPVFNNLQARDKRIAYAITDVTVNRDIIGMSRQTSVPIQKTPMLIFYSNGSPIAKFTGNLDVNSLSGFITKAMNESARRSQQNQQFARPQQPPQQGLYGQRPTYQPEQPQRRNNPYQTLGSGIEEEDDDKLLVPTTIIPKTQPWMGTFKEMSSMED